MAQQTINIGTIPNDNTGDPLRDAYDKCNQNFTELYAILPTPLSKLTQSSATSGQVPTWNGSAWVAATPASPPVTAAGATYQAISSNYAVGIVLGSTSATFLPYTIDGGGTLFSVFVLDITPTTCRFAFLQQDANAANDCDIGFQISATADFTVVLFEDYVALGTTTGLKTDSFVLTGLTGGPPYYVRWGYRNPTTLPAINAAGMTLVFF